MSKLPAPAASNKPSRKANAAKSSPQPAAADDDGEVNPFPVETPKSSLGAFDPLATPPHRAAPKQTPAPTAAPVAATGPADVTGFDWLLTGGGAAAKKPAAAAAAAAAPARSAALVVPEGVDPFDVYWTGGGDPLPLPDSEPEPEPDTQPDEEDGDAEPAPDQKSAPKKAAAKPAARKPAAKAAAAAAADDSDDDKAGENDQKAAYEAASAASAAPAAAARKTGPFVCKIDALKFMRKGCPLLKFGSYGYPHFRQFQISTDNKKLLWYSAGKAITDSQIDLRDVDEIALGQHTDKFGKHKEVTQLEKSSFSVYYNYRKKTLDVIAKDPNEFMVWTRGLHELVKRAQKNENLAQLTELVLELTMQPNRRTNPDIIDVTTGKSIVDLVAGNQPAAAVDDTNDKGRYKVIGDNLAYMKKRILKYSDKLKQSQYYMSPQHNTMKELLKKLQENATKVSEAFHAGQFSLCDDELWRANVDLESLKNMMKAIDASID